jgi:hypothetical protein
LYDPVADNLYEAAPDRYVSDGNPPSALTAVYDYEALTEIVDSFESFADGAPLSRFLPLLPLREGFSMSSSNLRASPLEECEHPRFGTVRIKDETAHPAGSIWDRGTVVALSRALEGSRRTVLQPANGPSVPSAVQYIRNSELTSYCLLEPGEDSGEAVGTGKRIRWTDSSLPTVESELRVLSEKYGFVPALPGWNPYYGEGIKTVAYELADQLEELSSRIYVHTSSVWIPAYLRKGFRELRTLNWFEATPEVVQVRLGSENADEPQGIRLGLPQARCVDVSESRLRQHREEAQPRSENWTRELHVALAGAEIDLDEASNSDGVVVLPTGESRVSGETTGGSQDVRTLEGPPESLPDVLFDSEREAN